MEKLITNTCVIKWTITDPGLCVVHYQSESQQNYIWTFRRKDFRLAFRSVTNAVANSEGDLSYSDALIIHEIIRNLAGDDS